MHKLLIGLITGALVSTSLFTQGLTQLNTRQVLAESPAISQGPAEPASTILIQLPPPEVQTSPIPPGVEPQPEPVVVVTPSVPTPVAPPPQWRPEPAHSTWAMASALEQAVRNGMADFPGQYSVVVQDLTTSERWTLGADDRYHPASTIKMPVTLYALHQHMEGNLSWQQGIEYTATDFESPGGGLFETTPFGGYWPVENLVNRALMYSNNVAVNMLGRHLGWNNIRAFTRSIGGELYRLDDGTPQVTAMSELGWWLHLYGLSSQNPTKAELILSPMRDVAYDGRIGAGLPSGVSYLHKFGSYDGYYHDGGIVYTDRPYALIVMTHGGREDQADTAIARVSAGVYNVLK